MRTILMHAAFYAGLFGASFAISRALFNWSAQKKERKRLADNRRALAAHQAIVRARSRRLRARELTVFAWCENGHPLALFERTPDGEEGVFDLIGREDFETLDELAEVLATQGAEIRRQEAEWQQ